MRISLPFLPDFVHVALCFARIVNIKMVSVLAGDNRDDFTIRNYINLTPCNLTVRFLLAPGAHSQFGSGKNTQFEPEQRANPFENVFSKTAVFPPPAIAETDL